MASIDDLLNQAYGEKPAPSGQEAVLGAARSANEQLGLGNLTAGPPDTAGSLLRSGAAIGTQMIPSLLLGPEAGVIAKLLASGAGSVAGGAISRGKLAPDTAGLDFILGAGSEGAFQGAGAIGRRITGKAAMRAEGAAAEADAQAKLEQARLNATLEQRAKLADVEKTAGEAALKERATAEATLQSQKDAYQAQVLKHTDAAITDISKAQNEEELSQRIRQSLGTPAPLENPTIEALSARVRPVRETAEKGVRSVFRGLSGKFQATLQPYYHLPVDAGNYASAVESERALLSANKEEVSPALASIMRDVENMTPPATNPSGAPTNRPGQMTQEQIALWTRGARRAGIGATVETVDKVRQKLTDIVIGRGSAVDKRVANRMIGALDSSLQPVLPESVQADWTNLRQEWREANSVFSPNFRSTLFRADTPAAVADTLYGAAKGSKAHRALTVIAQTPKDEIPLLRSAFAEKLSQGDVVKNVEGLDPRVFKALFAGTGFENPKAWTEALRTNVVARLSLDEITRNPVLNARFNQRVQEGMRSLGNSKYAQAVAKAEETLRSTKNPGDAIAEALRGELTEPQAADYATAGMERPGDARARGELEGMRRPVLGRFQTYMEHRTAFHGALALISLGGMYSHNPIATIAPLAYIGSSKAAAAILASPARAKIWQQALTSKNWEQFGFWLGRLTAASLTEGMREADSAE